MTKRKTWNNYHKKWGYYSDLEFKIANSLHKFPPNGRNPNTKKKYKSSIIFVKSLRQAEKMKNQYKKLTKSAYKTQEGKSW